MTAQEGKDLRRQILRVAVELFIRQGYHGLAMREIAQALGVSKAALYYHFRDKEELFLAILETNLGEIGAAIDAAVAAHDTAPQRIRALVREILLQPVEQRAVIRLASHEAAHLSPTAQQELGRVYEIKFWGRIRDLLAAGSATGELREMDAAVATWALLGMMYPYFYPNRVEDADSARAVANQLAEIYLEGVRRTDR